MSKPIESVKDIAVHVTKGIVSSPSRRAVSSLEAKPRKFGQNQNPKISALLLTLHQQPGAVTSMGLIGHKQFLPYG